MDLVTVVFVAGTAALAGVIFGYFLRWIITLGRKGSMELTVKQTMLEAKDQAQKIVDKATEQAEELSKEIKDKEKEKEVELKKKEERLANKEDLLDKRQTDLEKELEELKIKINGVKELRDSAANLEMQQKRALEQVANLT